MMDLELLQFAVFSSLIPIFLNRLDFNEKNTEHFKEPESVLLENFFVQDHKNDENQKLLSLLRLTLSGRNKIYKKIEEKNYMIKNLMQEIEKKKKNYVRFLEKD